MCSPPIVRNLATGQETRLVPIGNRYDASDEPISSAIFDRRGHLIITGSTKASLQSISWNAKNFKIHQGQIIVYDALTLKPVTHCRQQGNQQQVCFHYWESYLLTILKIKSFSISRRNDYIITNSQDRVIRCYRLQDILIIKPGSTLQPIQRFQDIVNKVKIL